MNVISISQLKTNPSSVIAQASDYPVMVKNRNTIQGYVVGKALFERLITQLENQQDAQAVRSADFSKGRNFEDVANDLGI